MWGWVIGFALSMTIKVVVYLVRKKIEHDKKKQEKK